MKEGTKTTIAKEIVLNVKLVGAGIIIGILIMAAYGHYVFPHETHYTSPGRFEWNGKVIHDWPEDDTGDAQFVPQGTINIGAYWSAYFSNASKYDDYAYSRCFDRYPDYPYPHNPRISDVINAINKTRMECFKKDIKQFGLLSMLFSVTGIIIIRYLLLGMVACVKWVKKYK